MGDATYELRLTKLSNMPGHKLVIPGDERIPPAFEEGLCNGKVELWEVKPDGTERHIDQWR